MNCPRCDEPLIWGCDFDAEDLGFDESGIYTNYSCNCGVTVDVYIPFDKEE
jgi:hypothetical protein